MEEDFTYTVLDDLNKPDTYTLKAKEVTTLPFFIADILEKHLTDKLLFAQGHKIITPVDRDIVKKQLHPDDIASLVHTI